MKPQLRFVLVAALLLSPAARTHAQGPDYQGLTGGLFFGSVNYRLDDVAPPAHLAGGISAGYRFQLFKIGEAPVTLTPHFALTLTQFKGIALNSNEIGFSRIDKTSQHFEPALQLGIRLGRVRPYFLSQPGDVTIERYVNGNLLNYWGSGRSWGGGVEFPLNNVCGAGPNVSVRQMTAQLTNAEWRGTGTPPPGGSVRATIISIGWSGRFRGTRPLFNCAG